MTGIPVAFHGATSQIGKSQNGIENQEEHRFHLTNENFSNILCTHSIFLYI
jgi:hypothetical protein